MQVIHKKPVGTYNDAIRYHEMIYSEIFLRVCLCAIRGGNSFGVYDIIDIRVVACQRALNFFLAQVHFHSQFRDYGIDSKKLWKIRSYLFGRIRRARVFLPGGDISAEILGVA